MTECLWHVLVSLEAGVADGSCQIVVNLEGDFASYENPPDLGSKYFMIPSSCTKAWEDECVRRLQVRAKLRGGIRKHLTATALIPPGV